MVFHDFMGNILKDLPNFIFRENERLSTLLNNDFSVEKTEEISFSKHLKTSSQWLENSIVRLEQMKGNFDSVVPEASILSGNRYVEVRRLQRILQEVDFEMRDLEKIFFGMESAMSPLLPKGKMTAANNQVDELKADLAFSCEKARKLISRIKVNLEFCQALSKNIVVVIRENFSTANLSNQILGYNVPLVTSFALGSVGLLLSMYNVYIYWETQ